MSSSLIPCVLPNLGTHQLHRSIEMLATSWFVEPNYKVLNDALFGGDGLLWSPYLAMGCPIFANIQTQVLNPLAWIACLPDPSPEAAMRYVFTYMLLAGFLSFIFLRQFLPPFPSSFGALAYMLTGYFMLYRGMSEISSCALIPGLFYAIDRLFQAPRMKSVALLTFLTTAMVTICGIPELSLLAVCTAALYFCFRLFTETATKTKEARGRTISFYVGSNILAGLFAAPLLIPFAEFMRESFSSHVRANNLIPAGQEAFPFVSANLITYLSPFFFAPILRVSTIESSYHGFVGFWGIIVFSLAILATAHVFLTLLNRTSAGSDENGANREKLAIFCSTIVFLLLAKKFGCPALQWLGNLPLFGLILYWKYTEPIIAFLVATLSAIGLTWLGDRTLKLKTIRVVGSLVLGLYLLLALTSIPTQTEVARFYSYFIMAVSVVTIGLFFSLATLGASKGRNAEFSCLLIFAAAVVELMLNFAAPNFIRELNPRRDDNPYTGRPFTTFLRQSEYNKRYERLFAQDQILMGNWAGALGLYDSRAYDALYPKRLMPFFRAFAYGDKQVSLAPGCWMPACPTPPADLVEELYGYEPVVDPFINTKRAMQILRLWQLTSSRMIIRDIEHRSALPVEISKRAACEAPLIYDKEVNIFSLSRIIPRAALYYRVEIKPEENAVLARLTDLQFDPFSKVLLEQSDLTEREMKALAVFSSEAPGLEAQRITNYKGEVVDVQVEAKHPGLLVLNDVFYPGWHAFVDGQETKIIHANYLFRGVMVPAGNHLVTFRYRPMSLLLGLSLGGVGVLILAVWWGVNTIAERKRRTKEIE